MISYRIMLVATLFCSATVASAQIVECVDANGKKSYMQACPPGMSKQRNIEEPPPKVPPPKSAPGKSLSDQEKDFEKRRADRQKADAEAADRERKINEAKQTCSYARQRLEALESGRPSKRVDPESGEHIAMDEGQRQAEINRLNDEVNDNCR